MGYKWGGGVINLLVAWIQTHLHLQTSFIFLQWKLIWTYLWETLVVLRLLMMMRWGNFQMRSSLTCLRGMMATIRLSLSFSVANIAESFKKRGYIWPTFDGSHIDLTELPGYQYDANDALIWFRPKRALECENANEQCPAKKQAQASLMQLWKK